MIAYHSFGMVDIADITRPKSQGQMVDTRVVHPPREPRPDYDRMREAVHGKNAPKQPDERDDGTKR